uniref:Groucho/TLE N-terminal Q-rich domain-containing protein n=1 Tax=Stegastes partitus TaxID=144197 RepID=A0A3B4ZHX2_9TELE
SQETKWPYWPPLQHPVPLQPGQSFKFTVLETLDRIKEEFQFLQAQYHSLKLECEKLASEKTEMQRHYIMVSPITPSDPFFFFTSLCHISFSLHLD